MSELLYTTILKATKVVTKLISRTTVTGQSNIPASGPVILVANHLSNIDPVLLASKIGQKRHIRALAKDSLFSKPILKTAMKKMGHIPVIRNSRNANDALKVATKKVIEGEMAMIYPEGTIPKDLSEIKKLKTGAARLALLTGATIIPVAQWGAQNIMLADKPLSLFKAFLTRPQHRIIVGKPFESKFLTGVPIASENIAYEDVVKLTEEFQIELEKMTKTLR